MQVTFDHREPANPAGNVITFCFKPEQPLRYTAGQYIEFYIPHDDADDRGIKRWFTLSSSPTDELISISTKIAADRKSTFKQHLLDLKPGDQIKMVEPMGDFVLPKDTSIPLLFVAGGIGVTPMHSMIKWLKDTGETREIELLYAVNTLEEMAFEDLFKNTPGVKLVPLVTSPPEGYDGLTGRLTSDIILEHRKPEQMIYISGPEPMVELMEKELLEKGVDKTKLVLDFFPNYTVNL